MDLFLPMRVRKVSFENRIVMAPMVRFGMAVRDGVMGETLLCHYCTYANAGIGLAISQCLTVCASDDPRALGAGTSGGAGAYDARHIPYLRQLADAFHAGGTRFFAQLGKGGYAFGEAGAADLHALRTAELDALAADFVRAVRIVFEAGADGVELHGAHGFFLNQLASPRANNRTDVYGGSLAARLHFVRKVVNGVRAFAGDSFLLAYRMGWTGSEEEDVQTARALEEMGFDLLHVSHGIPPERVVREIADFPYGRMVRVAAQVRHAVSVPVIAVGGIETLARGEKLLRHGACDFVAYGRPFLADPQFAKRGAVEMEYRSCFNCRMCKWHTDGERCPARLRARRAMRRG